MNFFFVHKDVLRALYLGMAVWSAAFSLMVFPAQLLEIKPFWIDWDYTNDPCMTGNVICNRMNPEANFGIMALVGSVFGLLAIHCSAIAFRIDKKGW